MICRPIFLPDSQYQHMSNETFQVSSYYYDQQYSYYDTAEMFSIYRNESYDLIGSSAYWGVDDGGSHYKGHIL